MTVSSTGKYEKSKIILPLSVINPKLTKVISSSVINTPYIVVEFLYIVGRITSTNSYYLSINNTNPSST